MSHGKFNSDQINILHQIYCTPDGPVGSFRGGGGLYCVRLCVCVCLYMCTNRSVINHRGAVHGDTYAYRHPHAHAVDTRTPAAPSTRHYGSKHITPTLGGEPTLRASVHRLCMCQKKKRGGSAGRFESIFVKRRVEKIVLQ